MVGNQQTQQIRHDIKLSEVQKLNLNKRDHKKAYSLSDNVNFEGAGSNSGLSTLNFQDPANYERIIRQRE